MDDAALEISGLSKSFSTGPLALKRRLVLRGLNLSVRRGEIFGYLGPNGAGKTTTLKVVAGLVRADSGSIRVLGQPFAEFAWRHRVGFLPENPYFYDYLTAREYLAYVARLFGLGRSTSAERIRDLLGRLGLTRSADQPLRRFSKGMVQRLGIAQALVNDPDLVFLDEPMSGLDPIGRHLVRGIILELKRTGKTILFSTHILSDAETLCDRVALLRNGELLSVGRLDEILDQRVSHLEVLATGLTTAGLEGLPESVRAREAVGERWRLEVAEDALGTVVSAIERAAGRVISVYPVRQSLEEYFFREMGGAGAPGESWDAAD